MGAAGRHLRMETAVSSSEVIPTIPRLHSMVFPDIFQSTVSYYNLAFLCTILVSPSLADAKAPSSTSRAA